jgi:hypothetical protein
MNAPTDKFRRYRAKKKAQGLREVRLWVPDVHAPGFQERLDREIAAINASEDEAAVLRWCEAAAVESWNMPD